MPFNPPDLTKGTITTTQSRRVIKFMFNPTTIRRQHGWAHGVQPVGGRSHPFRSGGAGTNEPFTMTLYLDGDRGRSDDRIGGIDFDPSLGGVASLSVEPELNDLMALPLPYDPDFGEAYGVPEPIMLDMGRTAPFLECDVDDVSYEVFMFTKRLEPYKATVDLTLSVRAEFNQTAWSFLAERPSRSLDPNEDLLEHGQNRKLPLVPRTPVPGGLSGSVDPLRR